MDNGKATLDHGQQDALSPVKPRVPAAYVLMAALLLTVSGLVHGLWTQRWYTSNELTEAAARLDAVPLTVADWQGTLAEIDTETIRRAGLARCWMRAYTRARSGEQVTVLLMCGRPGPASVHTPEWCYGGAGYEMITGPNRRTVALAGNGPPAELWTARFAKPGASESPGLRIYWMWNCAGQWQAPDHPRLTFARAAVLYKLYILQNISAGPQAGSDGAAAEFMQVFLPQLNEWLFPTNS